MNTRSVLLLGFFGHRNLGDDLLLKEALTKYPKDMRIFVFWPKNAVIELEYFQKYHPFTPIYSRKEMILHYYDAVIWSGGGLFPKRTFQFKNFFWMLPYRIFSKKLILNGLGIVEKPIRKWFDCFLGMVDYCSVRDDKSLEFVSSKIPAINCGDLYWGANLFGGGKIKTSHKLLVCLANPFNEKELEDKRIALRFDKLTLQCVDFIAQYKKKGFEVNFLPFYHGSDEKFIAKVQGLLGSVDKVLQRDVDFNLDNIDELFQQYDLGLCMRFHSILLSVKNSLPVVAIEYDFKSEQLLKEAGLSEFGVRFGIRKSEFFGKEIDIEENSLCLIAEKVQKNKDIFQQRAKSFAERKHNQVLENYQNILKIINNI